MQLIDGQLAVAVEKVKKKKAADITIASFRQL